MCVGRPASRASFWPRVELANRVISVHPASVHESANSLGERRDRMDGSNVMARVRERVDTWLAEFEEALAVRDIERVAGLFATSSFWRDLIAFTWNIATVEGREGVAELLRTTLDATGPWGFRTTEEPTEAGGVVEAWPVFETAVGRGQRAHHPE